MQEFREGEERFGPSPLESQTGSDPPDASRLEDVGDLHYQSAAYSPALEYYRSALQLLVPDGEPKARLHRKISDCLTQQGQFSDAERELACAARFAEDLGSEVGATLSVRRAQLLLQRGEYVAAVDCARDAFAVLAVTNLHAEVARIQIVMGSAHLRLGRRRKAEEFYSDALATYRRIGDDRSQGHVLHNLAIMAKNDCRWDRAVQLYDRSEKLLRSAGATYEICVLKLNRAILARKMGRRDEAMALAREGETLSNNLGAQGRVGRFRLLKGQLLIDAGRYAQAEKVLLDARVLAEGYGGTRERALADEFLGDLMAAMGRWDEALANYDLAEERAREISEANDILAEVQRRRAEVFLASGDLDAAETAADEGLALVDACGEEFERPYLVRTLGRVARERGNHAAAESRLEEALRLYQRLRLTPERAATLQDLVDLNVQRGGAEALLKARAHLHDALRLDLPEAGVSPCHLQLRLARLELDLGHHEDALLALFEVERHNCSLEDPGIQDRVEEVRAEIERAMASQVRDVSEEYRQLVGESDAEAAAPSGDLEEVLTTLVRRLGADRCFVAVTEGDRTEIVATHGVSRAIAAGLAAAARGAATERGLRVWTHARQHTRWQGVDDAGSAIAVFPLSGEDAEAIVYFDRSEVADGAIAFDRDSLAMASTYLHLVGDSFLAGRLRPRRAATRPNDAAFEHIITHSERVFGILELCAKVAPSPYTVLLTGETGTGKGLLARTIHELSPRREAEFTSVNCAAIPETLLEGELFGHVKGSFTGADRDRPGLIVSAEGGSLFLDEVGKMSLPMQAKLLHFLDTKEVRPVGGTKTVTIDVRVLCASKCDLQEMVEQGLFLEDLYYRLLDFPIEVPPLRDRGDDVVLLARHYAEKAALELGRAAPTMTRGFLARLRGHDWPGNVRELEKAIKRASILAADEGRLHEAHLPALADTTPRDDRTATTVVPLRDRVAELESRAIQDALDATGWNRAEAARQLKISYPTLLQKIRGYGLQPL